MPALDFYPGLGHWSSCSSPTGASRRTEFGRLVVIEPLLRQLFDPKFGGSRGPYVTGLSAHDVLLNLRLEKARRYLEEFENFLWSDGQGGAFVGRVIFDRQLYETPFIEALRWVPSGKIVDPADVLG